MLLLAGEITEGSSCDGAERLYQSGDWVLHWVRAVELAERTRKRHVPLLAFDFSSIIQGGIEHTSQDCKE